MIKIYTDGSCLGNPGIGGWAYYITEEDKIPTLVCGNEFNTTNNRMELTAVIKAIRNIIHIGLNSAIIYTDSQYVINIATGKYKYSKNEDLWKKYELASKDMSIEYVKVRAHSNIYENEVVDRAARMAAELVKE